MHRLLLGFSAACLLAGSSTAADLIRSPRERFAAPEAKEAVSFQRHVVPLLGRLGCSGRACHGSFQGQGGFRLSLFGYDFAMDHKALTAGPDPRADLKNPLASLVLVKPTLKRSHKGGKRLEVDSWQYRLLRQWIQDGAPNDANEHVRLEQLTVEPRHIVFHMPGEKVQLQVIAHWPDGSAEDVTELSRFRTNDDAIATISDSGLVTAAGKGDTHVVAFYDNGIMPVPVVLPVSDRLGERYPAVPTPTRVDELVVAKLKQTGIVPSELCTDREFLRRLSLDLTGTLPTSTEVEAFAADTSADKRFRKIDELLSRPAYAAWWATKLCDLTGNNGRYRDGRFGPEYARQWYDWIYRRVRDNAGYDQIVSGIVLANSRLPGQSFNDYCEEMSSYYHKDKAADFSKRPTMPHYWSRQNFTSAENKALGFSYTFLGVRLQCAQCHKHPFDQWTKQDFERFKAFFERIVYSTPPADREAFVKMEQALIPLPQPVAVKKIDAASLDLAREGLTIPFREVYVAQPGDTGNVKGAIKVAKVKNPPQGKNIIAKLLGDEEVVLNPTADPREALMKWLLRKDNPYLARAWVNRVWAGYFNVGIIAPPDDLSLANPPSNAPLLDYLTKGFVDHGYDMRWLHREIVSSRTYQLSWKPNDTNGLDTHNFSHAVPRRLPAEVAVDAVVQATTATDALAAWQEDVSKRAIAMGSGPNYKGKGGSGTVLAVFGKPNRVDNCDCERSSDPSLLQTLFLLNDGEILSQIDRRDGWVFRIGQQWGPVASAKGEPKAGKESAQDQAVRAKVIANLERRIQELQSAGKNDDATGLKGVLQVVRQGSQAATPKGKGEPPAVARSDRKASPEEERQLIREAYLRTVSRPPTDQEVTRAQQYLQESASTGTGMRDLLWALLNTKEFIVNH